MSTKKQNSAQNKTSNEKRIKALIADVVSSSTAGNETNIITEKAYTTGDEQNAKTASAPPIAKELIPKSGWNSNLITIATVVGIIIPIIGFIVWLAKLDSKVDNTTADLTSIKPKVDKLIINNEKHELRLDFLEHKSLRKK